MLDHSAYLRACREGRHGNANQWACHMLSTIGEAFGASEFIPIQSAHLVGSYWSSEADIQLLSKLEKWGGRFSVRTSLNASSACLQRPSPSSARDMEQAHQVVELHRQLGAERTLTCAPYHLDLLPNRGDNVAWAESNAIVYANSVCGARTERMVQYADLAAAILGWVPNYGLYSDANRRASVVIDAKALSGSPFDDDALWPQIGVWLGRNTQDEIPALINLPAIPSNDHLRALGAAAAAAGNTRMFHAVGITPEAPSLEQCIAHEGVKHIDLEPGEIHAIAKSFRLPSASSISDVCIGAPHASVNEILALGQELTRPIATPVWITTSRYNVDQLENTPEYDRMVQLGVEFVTDVCSYYGPTIVGLGKTVATTSAKWAYYGPGNLNVKVHLCSIGECARIAMTGEVPRG
jgi:predicted aconitase